MENTFEEIVNKYRAYIKFTVYKFYTVNKFERDDLYNEGLFAVYNATQKYKPALGVPINAYVFKSIKHAMYKHYNLVIKKTRKELSLDAILADSASGCCEFNAEKFLISDENVEANAQERCLLDILYEAISMLPEDEKYIICRYYGIRGVEPLTCNQISGILNCSRNTVDKKKKRAISKLKDILMKYGYMCILG